MRRGRSHSGRLEKRRHGGAVAEQWLESHPVMVARVETVAKSQPVASSSSVDGRSEMKIESALTCGHSVP